MVDGFDPDLERLVDVATRSVQSGLAPGHSWTQPGLPAEGETHRELN